MESYSDNSNLEYNIEATITAINNPSTFSQILSKVHLLSEEEIESIYVDFAYSNKSLLQLPRTQLTDYLLTKHELIFLKDQMEGVAEIEGKEKF